MKESFKKMPIILKIAVILIVISLICLIFFNPKSTARGEAINRAKYSTDVGYLTYDVLSMTKNDDNTYSVTVKRTYYIDSSFIGSETRTYNVERKTTGLIIGIILLISGVSILCYTLEKNKSMNSLEEKKESKNVFPNINSIANTYTEEIKSQQSEKSLEKSNNANTNQITEVIKAELEDLKFLYDKGFIEEKEYKERKSEITNGF